MAKNKYINTIVLKKHNKIHSRPPEWVIHRRLTISTVGEDTEQTELSYVAGRSTERQFLINIYLPYDLPYVFS